MNIAEKLKELREAGGLYLREVATALEVDNAYVSKFESGEKIPLKKHIQKLAAFYKVPEKELLTIWLSDKILELIKDEPTAEASLQLTLKRVKK